MYNALIIPFITYNAQVWYIRKGQKSLTNILQVTQNDGIWKITRVFHTTPMDSLYNMIGVPPIPFLLDKLLHAYRNYLQVINPACWVLTIA
jgi:hypothetical protein